jgi:hypothetical protein
LSTENFTTRDHDHMNQVINHHNNQDAVVRARLKTHADNDDHDSMTAWVNAAARTLGIQISATAAAGAAWWLIKHYKRR